MKSRLLVITECSDAVYSRPDPLVKELVKDRLASVSPSGGALNGLKHVFLPRKDKG